MKNRLRRQFIATVFFFLFYGVGFSQDLSESTGVPVKFWISANATYTGGEPGAIDVDADVEPSPLVTNGVFYDSSSRTSAGPYTTLSKTLRFLPGRRYAFNVISEGNNSFTLNAIAPPGYQAEIEGVVRSSYNRTVPTNFNTRTVWVRVFSPSEEVSAPAGTATSLANGRILWQVAMGSMTNGGSASSMSLIDSASGSWTSAFTPAALHYNAPSYKTSGGDDLPYQDVKVYRYLGNLRQIVSPEATADIVTLSATSYEVKFYHAVQTNGTTFPRTFTGSPFITYKIEQGATASTLKITSTTKNISSGSPYSGSGGRSEVTTLKREALNSGYAWTRTDWASGTAVSEDYQVWSTTGGSRTESIEIRAPGSSTAEIKANRSITEYNWGEEVTSSTQGTGTNAVTTNYNYYTNSASAGSYGYVLSSTSTGGHWEAYEYHPWAGDYAGTVKRVLRPYGDLPAAAPADPSTSTSGEITTYDYELDAFGHRTRPSQVETKINNTSVAKSTITYTDTTVVNNMYLVVASRSDYTSSTASLTSVTKYYREDTWLEFYRSQLHSVTAPNGARRSYAYQRGTWNDSTKAFTGTGTGFDGSGNPSGPASRMVEFVGTTSNQSTGQQTTYNGYDIDDVYLVTGKSMMNVTIRDNYARVVRTESSIWTGSAWQVLAWTNYGYNWSNQLVSRSDSNGGSFAATYDGDLMTSQTGETGISVSFVHDAGGRVQDITQSGQGGIHVLTTRYTYNSAGQVLTKTVGQGLSETLVTTQQYDDAGRISAAWAPGVTNSTSISYEPSTRKTTTTYPNGGTRIEELNLDGTPKKVTGTAVVEEHFTYSIDNTQSKTVVKSGASNSARTATVWNDWLGRQVKTERPGFAPTGQAAFTENYNYSTSTGLLSSVTRSASLATAYFTYDALGNRLTEGLDVDGGGLSTGGTDRITGTEQKFVNTKPGSSDWWLYTRTYTYGTSGASTEHTLSTDYQRITGFNPTGTLRSETYSVNGDGRTSTSTVNVSTGTKTATITSTIGGLNASTITLVNGFKVSEQGADSLFTTYTYDSLHRLSKLTDSRDVETRTTYKFGSNLPEYVTDGSNTIVSTQTYNVAGQRTLSQDAYGNTTRYAYNARGQVTNQWGSGSYPIEFGYDNTFGQRTSLKTYRNAPSTDSTSWPAVGSADTTQWAFDAATGLLHYKTMPNGMATVYSYDGAGRTTTREWVRRNPSNSAEGVKSFYAYTPATGELSGITYNDGTTGTSYTYSRLGQIKTVADATGTRTFNYDSSKPWRLTSEALPAFFGSRVISRLYETSGAFGRYRGFQLGSSGDPDADLEQVYTVSAQARFTGLTSKRANNAASITFNYGYYDAVNSKDTRLVHSLSIAGSHPFTTTRTYKSNLNLLESVESKWSTSSRTKFVYAYESRHKRESVVQSGSVFSAADSYGDDLHQNFDYNERGELTTAATYKGSNVGDQSNPLPGRHYDYDYDSIGNRKSSGNTGTPSLQDDYTVNSLNQYETRENNTVNVSGVADSNANVLVDNNPALAARQGRYWSDQYLPANTSGPAKPNITVRSAKPGAGSGGADLVRTDLVSLLFPAAQQTLTYDLDGNLTGDGLFTYQWDAENRLIRVLTAAGALAVGADNVTIEFKYDYLGRRVEKHVNNATNTAKSYQHRYIYDGWNLIAEIDVALGLGTVRRSFAWGLDLVGSLTSSGGVGALLEIRDNRAGQLKTLLPTYDGNGNIVSLINAATTGGDAGKIEAVYEYSPFGELIRGEGEYAGENPFRFSTKFQDDETNLIYYGHRYYDAHNGRFINRDPIEEAGGLNLYGFVGNDGVNGWDYLGQSWFSKVFKKIGRAISSVWQKVRHVVIAYALRVVGTIIGGPVLGEMLGSAYEIGVGAKYGGLKGAAIAAFAPRYAYGPNHGFVVNPGVIGVGGGSGRSRSFAMNHSPRTSARDPYADPGEVVWREAQQESLNAQLEHIVFVINVSDTVGATFIYGDFVDAGVIVSPSSTPDDRIDAAKSIVIGAGPLPNPGPGRRFLRTVARAKAGPELTKNLISAGVKKFPGDEAHHIVAFEKKIAADARKILERYGIDLNSAENGVFLPGPNGVPNTQPHRNIHTDSYFQKVNALIIEAGAQGKDAVLDTLERIRLSILDGTFP